jgi:hypothetical protein
MNILHQPPKLGMQTPVSSRTETQKKTRTFQHVRANVSFSKVVGILENASVAAEGLEQTAQTSQKRSPVFKGEAKPEALFEASSSDLENLARALANQLGQYETLELIKHLVSRVQ